MRPLAKAFKEQTKIATAPNSKTLQLVLKEGLLPLQKKLDGYLTLDNYSEVITGGISVGSRSRLLYRKRALRIRTLELEQQLIPTQT